ncbi:MULTISPECIES: DUF7139 domain-containing protein [Halolamina]|uniref:Uncharacterized protein n=1 Tax=Halolamina pelagica TaxID=699431 RepID=A0A1I5RZD2_9EURY|nr:MULTISPECIES: phage holin family protein [Halolamina]NHX35413.1 ribonuclease BN [Halolamina sp. R1-12]SFP63681.1 hypothetical protein SAMN05216277_105212 [Halolamina pelagica]
MTSLSEVYKPDAEFQTSLRRLYAGLGLFAVGGLLAIAGVIVGAITPFDSLTASWEWAGILAGLGVPAAILGIFAVLPSGRRTRAAAVIGAALSILGVALFAHAYPCQWVGTNCLNGRTLLTLPVALLYAAGIITTLWCLFTGIVNFESRNSPGGTAHVEVTTQGETKVIEVPTSELPKFSSSMGVLGDTPDVEAPDRPGAGGGNSSVASDGGASTNAIDDLGGSGAFVDESEIVDAGPSTPSNGASTSNGSSNPAGTDGSTESVGSKPPRRENRESAAGRSTGPSNPAAGGSAGDVSDVGSGNSPRRDDDWTPTGASPDRAESGPDRDSYCGSCRHFEYVQTERGMQPYCGFHEDLMDDMDACDDYTPRQ